MSLPTRPMTPALARDLTDAEIAELDDLLAATPEPLEPLDVVMLDGYLCGVIVQPVLLLPDTWLPHVFDFDATPLPEDADPTWLARVTALILRRHTALNRAIIEDGWFEPLVLEPNEDQPIDATADGAASAMPPAGHDEREANRQSDAESNPVSSALMPWVAGFQHATLVFPDLAEMPDDAVMASLARLFRHLPAETDEAREIVAMLDREHPLATLDDAMEDLVVTIADLQDLTSDLRYKVEPVKRDTPKVGRNEPCPCGSGKKFKQCHGAG